MNNNARARSEEDRSREADEMGRDRRQFLLLSAAAGACAMQVSTAGAEGANAIAPPRRALTGRDASGKSVFQSFDVTPQVINFKSIPGLAFYELYATDDVPRLTGQEPDPMTTKKGSFPKPNGSLFRLVVFPPAGSPGSFEGFLDELSQKIPGMAEHFDRSAPGMHVSDSLDYDIVIRGELILELDDGKSVHLRPGDCVIQNGTRHRWINPLSEPCLMASVLIGGQRQA